MISCITPTTAARRWCLPLAIRWFQEQTLDAFDREMVIVFSGPGTVKDLIPDDDRIRLIELDGDPSLGAKHNIACEAVNGDWIAKWDDDDYHPPDHLAHTLSCATPWAKLVGRSSVIIHELTGPRRTVEYDHAFHYSTPRFGKGATPTPLGTLNGVDRKSWVAGNSMIVHRDLWRTQPFPDRASGVDTVFVWQALEHSKLIQMMPFRHVFDNAVILGAAGGTVVMEYGQSVGRKNWDPKPPEYVPWPSRPTWAHLDEYERAFEMKP